MALKEHVVIAVEFGPVVCQYNVPYVEIESLLTNHVNYLKSKPPSKIISVPSYISPVDGSQALLDLSGTVSTQQALHQLMLSLEVLVEMQLGRMS